MSETPNNPPEPSVPPSAAPPPTQPQQKKRGGCLRIALIVIGIFIALGIVGAMLGGGDEGTSEQYREPVAAEEAVATEEAAPKATQAPLKDQIEQAVSEARDRMSKFEWDSKSGVVTVTYDDSDESYLSENTLIRQLATDTVDVMAAAFAFDKVKRVNTIYLIEMTDQFGNAESERGVEIDWTRKLWSNVQDPESFKSRIMGSDETLMYGLATYYYVHPGIWKNTKLQEEGMSAFGSQ